MPLTSVLPSFVFVWPSNCGRGILTLMTAVRPSRMSSPVMLSFRSFASVVLRRVVVDRPRQRRAEPREVRAAFVRVDVVREGVDRLRVAVVPLQRDLGVDAVLLAAHVDRLLVDRRLVLVQVRRRTRRCRLRSGTCGSSPSRSSSSVIEDAAVQERELAQALRERVEAEVDGFEDLRVRLERDFRAATLRGAGDLELVAGVSALVRL